MVESSPGTDERPPRVSLVTLGCARNDVDSEELAGRLAAEGWDVSASADGTDGDADVVVVNTCTFVEQAKKDSVDAVLAAGGGNARVVAVGCMAERYGAELAEALPEAAAVLGFDHYGDLPSRLDDVLAGRPLASHTPSDRRTLLPISPVKRPEAVRDQSIPGHEWVPTVPRQRLDDAPVAPLKLASGCDRRCSFCAIPSFRGAFVSRDPRDVVAEAAWLADHGVAEVLLVSENSTSYGKDIDARGAAGGALERLLGELAAVPGLRRVRVSYLQPAEVRPPLLAAIARTPRVAPYFDLSFQHASAAVLRRMRRFGSRETFLALCREIRALDPEAGIRSNVIVGFPGETEEDLAELEAFLAEAELDAVGVFGYSDEDGTEALGLPDKVDPTEIAARVERITQLAEHVAEDRAARRVGTTVEVLVERFDADDELLGGPRPAPGPGRRRRVPSGGRSRAARRARPGCRGAGAGDRRRGDRPGGRGAGRRDRRCRRGRHRARVRPHHRCARRCRSVVTDAGPGGPSASTGVVAPVPLVNIANGLTVARLLLVPVFLVVLFVDHGQSPAWRWAAFAVFAIASLTDTFDGDLARRWGLVTDFGKIADPIADKALTGAALVGLSMLGELAWWVTITIAVRELGVTLLRFWVLRHGVIPASRGGKIKTVVQTLALGLAIMPLPAVLEPAVAVLMVAAVVVTVVTGVDYLFRALRLRSRAKARAAA